MQNKYLKYILPLLVIAFIVPQIALAAWWNPVSWNWNVFGWFGKLHAAVSSQNASNNKPFIRVIYPGKGENWEAVNDANTVQWTYYGIDNNSSVSIEIVDQNNKTVCDVSEGFVPLKNGTWEISHDYLSASGCIGGNRKIQMIFHGNKTTLPSYDVTGYSDYFNIVAVK